MKLTEIAEKTGDAIALNLKNSPFLRDTKQPTVIGTFTGGGGSSLGFHLAGFKELLAVEYDDNAVEKLKFKLFRQKQKLHLLSIYCVSY